MCVCVCVCVCVLDDIHMADDLGTIDQDLVVSCLQKALLRLPKLSGPGPLGMRNEHVCLLARSTECQKELAGALADLSLGRTPVQVIEFLRGGRLRPLEKPTGGIRPLTLGNVVRRAALAALVRQKSSDNAKAVGSAQFGISRKSGIDLLQKSLRAHMAVNPNGVLVAIDFVAAFQNVSRSAVFAAVSKHAPWLQEAASAWYGGAAVHTIFDDAGNLTQVHAKRGVDQGCPLGALLFASVMRDPTEATLEYARSLDPKAAVYFYLDDGYVLCDKSCVERVLSFIKRTFATIGASVNERKLQVWASDRSLIPAPLNPYLMQNIKILGKKLSAAGDDTHVHEGLPVLSAAHSLDGEISRLQALGEKLGHLMQAGLDRQTALSLLRVYA